jgi:hypothetical protein
MKFRRFPFEYRSDDTREREKDLLTCNWKEFGEAGRNEKKSPSSASFPELVPPGHTRNAARLVHQTKKGTKASIINF